MNAFCQDKKIITPAELKADVITIAANEHIAATGKLPFSSVRVLDYRFDTSKIGFGRDRNALDRDKSIFDKRSFLFRKITVKSGLQYSIEKFYNRYYQHCFSTDSSQLLVVIKRFWADPFPNLLKVREQSAAVSRESDFNLYVQFEILLCRNDLYLPIKRIDTVFQISPVSISSEYQQFTEKGYAVYEYALVKVFESLDHQMYAAKFENSKNKKTLPEVILFNEKRFNYPVLLDSVLKPGVYMSFAEFRNNAPSIAAYKLVIDKKLGRNLYYNSSSDSTKIFKYFGYCDGRDIYCGDLEHPLIRVGHTFEFFTNRTDYYNVSVPALYYNDAFSSAIIKQEKKNLEPFQLDMETGKIY